MPFFLPKRAISKYDLPEQQLFIQNEIKFFRELADDMLCFFELFFSFGNLCNRSVRIVRRFIFAGKTKVNKAVR